MSEEKTELEIEEIELKSQTGEGGGLLSTVGDYAGKAVWCVCVLA